MITSPKMPSISTSKLRSIIHKIPKEIRDLARKERQHFCKMESQYPGSYSFAMAKGAGVENAKLQAFVNELQAREAQRVYMQHLR